MLWLFSKHKPEFIRDLGVGETIYIHFKYNNIPYDINQVKSRHIQDPILEESSSVSAKKGSPLLLE